MSEYRVIVHLFPLWVFAMIFPSYVHTDSTSWSLSSFFVFIKRPIRRLDKASFMNILCYILQGLSAVYWHSKVHRSLYFTSLSCQQGHALRCLVKESRRSVASAMALHKIVSTSHDYLQVC